MAILAVLSTFVGAWLYPGLEVVFPPRPDDATNAGHTLFQFLATGAVLAGLALAGWLFLARRRWLDAKVGRGLGARLWILFNRAWGFDALFDRTLVRPWQTLVRVLRFDFINLGMNLPAVIARLCNAGLVRSQDGQLRTYAKVMVFGATVILVGLVMTQGGGA